MNKTPYLSTAKVVLLACLAASSAQAQSLAGSYPNAVGFGALGGIVVLMMAWTQALRRLSKQVPPSAGSSNDESSSDEPPTRDSDTKNAEAWEDEREFFRALLEHAPDCIYFKDRRSRFRRCNKAMCERFGISEQDILGKTDFDNFDEAHARLAFEDEQEIMRTGLGFKDKVEREVMPDGSEFWALSSKMPLRDRAGKIIGTFGISKDITALKRVETLLADQRDLLSTLLDNTLDTIYFKDVQSRFVRVSHSKVESALAIARAQHLASHPGSDKEPWPPHLAGTAPFAQYIIGKTDFDFFAKERANSAFNDEQEIIRSGLPMANKVEKTVRADGKITWSVTTKAPWHAHDGRIIGTFGISKDVTFIKEAEAKLEAAHKQLVETSRMAGMAEVATTVLHNVGNVLNSVNISASIVADKVRDSKAANLVKASEMLREHASDLAGFLTNDPKGSKLPAYFAAVAESLAAEHREIQTELASLCANIEHIKEIVAMQQAYAKMAGVQETLNPADLVEDALRLNAGAVERHNVHVTRQFSSTPPILVDKHKVLQILVNLIRNAKYALEDHDPADKQMILKIEPTQLGGVKIYIIDNGIGIPPENLTRIFGHGFTTRRNGHGFALHSGALVARQMGGSLTCKSDGPGQGASFTLELPSHPPEVTE